MAASEPRDAPSDDQSSFQEPDSPSGPRVPEKESLLAYQQSVFVGPLPPPAYLAEYEKICPGSADRILTLTEDQAHHRHAAEMKMIDATIRERKAGQLMAFSVSTLICGGGIYLLAQGNDISGLVALLTPLAGLAGLFIMSRRPPPARKPPSE